MVSAVYKVGLFDGWALLYNSQVGPQLLFLGDLQWSVSTGWGRNWSQRGQLGGYCNSPSEKY